MRSTRKNSDAARRRREREAAGSGAPTDEARVLVERLRAGELEPGGLDRITLAAVLGDEGARAAVPNWPAATEFATMGGRLGPDDPFVLGAVADSLRGYLRPWGPEVMRQVYSLSADRVVARLQTRHRDAGGWRTTYDRAITYMTQENFSAALDAMASVFLFTSNEDDHFAMNDEQARQQADMIAILLARPVPRTTLHPNPRHAHMNSDAEQRRLQRLAEQGDPQAEARLAAARIRARLPDLTAMRVVLQTPVGLVSMPASYDATTITAGDVEHDPALVLIDESDAIAANEAVQGAVEGFERADWTHELSRGGRVVTFGDGSPRYCHGAIRGCDVCEAGRAAAELCAREGRSALHALFSGNVTRALQHAEEAQRAENEFGDSPAWRPAVEAIRRLFP